MKKLYFAALVITSIAMTGCANQEKLNKNTDSGKSEGNYEGKNLKQTSSSFVRFCNKNGFFVYSSSESMVICGKQREGMSSVIAQVMIGNQHSTPPVDKMQFSISEDDKGSHVWADAWTETQMPGGQVNKMPLNDNKTRNFVQYILDNIQIH